MRNHKTAVLAVLVVLISIFMQAQSKPKLTLDDFFNGVGISDVQLSPDGSSVVIGTYRADWDRQIFRGDLWLHRSASGGSLVQLTNSGHDGTPRWSPDGRWIAFLSERKTSAEKDDSDSDSKDEGVAQLYLISPDGGEAFAVTQGEEEVHTFVWSADSRTLYFATRNPWTKEQKDDYKKNWKDVVQYRTAERGDTLFALDLSTALAQRAAKAAEPPTDPEKKSDLTPGAQAIAKSDWRIADLVAASDGSKLAFRTESINQRQEKLEDFEIYSVDLSRVARAPSPASATAEAGLVQPHQITHNQGVEDHLHWANDSKHIFFSVEVGDVSGPYRDLQPHLYWLDADRGKIEQWSKDFVGPVESYAPAASTIVATGRLGTEVQMYTVSEPGESLRKLNGWPGTYASVSASQHSPRVAFVYSSLGKPEEVYLADSADALAQASPITSFNKVLAECDLPQGKPYQWRADDGTTVEGMLIYPPGKFEAKHLPMLVLIHGGPADADGNHFEADWYQWSALAATNGWLVFEPNYRGSTGYGDKFLIQIVPQMVSRPGKDILEGVDALVKDGIADPDHLAIGGYSYGGYMTNWLITQTTRFKAAMTGAGAVEHVGNWGNDDTTFDDAYFLGGRPWEAQPRYHDEAAIFQINKVKTPTHMVAGGSDIRVAVLEDYLLEHALHSLGVPNELLIFPGEGHELAKNPWHGKIKVREELKWLEKYGGVWAGK
ncbi:MAG TPA: S9 family peptidase [Candidatus Sulfotelmatobacter sp.]|nr:S9 family peptidase [Candidatus Sulfotelmatobacter sp.]